MANIAVQRIKREFKEVVKNEEVSFCVGSLWTNDRLTEFVNLYYVHCHRSSLVT